jgi:hypothetical protein
METKTKNEPDFKRELKIGSLYYLDVGKETKGLLVDIEKDTAFFLIKQNNKMEYLTNYHKQFGKCAPFSVTHTTYMEEVPNSCDKLKTYLFELKMDREQKLNTILLTTVIVALGVLIYLFIQI